MMKKIILIFIIFLLYTSISNSEENYNRFVCHNTTKGYFKKLLRKFKQEFDGSFAIIIGIDNYKYLPHLNSVRNDIKKMKDSLLISKDFDEIVVLQNDDANFNNIRYFMQTYFTNKMTKNGRYRFLFYYSGHGTQQIGYDDNILGYLQLKNASGHPGDSDVIGMTLIQDWASQFRYATHMLFLLDCCFSGLAGKEIKSTKEYNTEANISELATNNGRFMITAGGKNEISIANLSKWGGSLFTDVVISGMNGKGSSDANSDGIITTYELYSYIQGAVRNESQRDGYDQNPLISNLGKYTDTGQFFFVYKNLESLVDGIGRNPESVDISEPKGKGDTPKSIVQPSKFYSLNNSERFLKNADGIILDKKTNLMWATNNSPQKRDWDSAIIYCNNYKKSIFSDWRLPSLDEVEAIYNSKILKEYSMIEVWAKAFDGKPASFDFEHGDRFSKISPVKTHYILPVRNYN